MPTPNNSLRNFSWQIYLLLEIYELLMSYKPKTLITEIVVVDDKRFQYTSP